MRKVGGHVSIAGGIANAIKNTQVIGGNCMQIFAGSPRLWARILWLQKDTENFVTLVKESGLNPVFIHALYLVNLATDNPELLEKSENSLIVDIKNGAQINSEGVIVHIGSHQGRGFDSAKNQIVSSLKKILNATNNCDFLLENDAGQNGKIGSVDEIAYLIKEVNSPRLKICFDTAHLFEGGLDMRKKEVVEQFILELKSQNILEKIKCVHLNDSATDLDSHRDNHADLGKGKIGIDGLRNFVNHPALIHLPLILETPGPDKMGPNKENIAIAISL
jgi:deoxyribonuclease-4